MTTWRAALVVARRELIERVRSKWYVAATLLGPIGLFALLVIPALIGMRGTTGVEIDILDRSGSLAQPIAEALEAASWKVKIVDPDTTEEAELARIRDASINGFIVVPADALQGGEILYRGDNASSQVVSVILKQAVYDAVRLQRGERAGMTEADMRALLEPPRFRAQHTTGEGDGSMGLAAFVVGYLVAITLYMAITLYGLSVMRSVAQEKSTRVMDLLLAAVEPRALMAGKILGVGTSGLLQMAAWFGMGAITLAQREAILRVAGVPGGGLSLPEFSPVALVVILTFFVLGYFLYAAMFAAMGALASSEHDTQPLQIPATLLLAGGVLCLQVIADDPRGDAARVLTMLPMWSPMLMPMRFLLGGASSVEVVISIAILVVSTLAMVRAAAKIYRVGALMQGKRPSIREVVRWLRH